MLIHSCGLDFGTSNSTLGVIKAGDPVLVPLEGEHLNIPSAIFFDFEGDSIVFGRAGIAQYTGGIPGRLLRGLKSILGTQLMRENTQVKSRRLSFQEILGLFIAHMKQRGEEFLNQEITHAVLGRPVYFVDGNPDTDRRAQDTLADIARRQGLKHVEFQFEPIAAALEYERAVNNEQVALIVDIGGGTSDFTVIRLRPDHRQSDRSQDILATDGVHIGGTDFDRWLSLAKMMPLMGHNAPCKQGRVMPSSWYHQLATWHRIDPLYGKKPLHEIRSVRADIIDRHLLNRLETIIKKRLGHAIAALTEETKISLSASDFVRTDLSLIEADLDVNVTRDELNTVIDEGVHCISRTVDETLRQAALAGGDVDVVFLTGGSSQLRHVRESILHILPEAQVVEGDAFGSVGRGLTLHAERIFNA